MLIVLPLLLPIALAIDITDCPKDPLALDDTTAYNIKTTDCLYKFVPSTFVFSKIDPDENYKNCQQCFSLEYNTYYYNHTDRVSGSVTVPPVPFQLSVDSSKVPSFEIIGLSAFTNSLANIGTGSYNHYAKIIRVSELLTNSLLTVNTTSTNLSVRVGYGSKTDVFFFSNDQYLSSSEDVFKMQKTLGPLISPGNEISLLPLTDSSSTDLTSFLVNVDEYNWGVATNDVSIEEISSANISLAFAYHDKPRLVYLLNGVNPLDSTLQVINVEPQNVHADMISFYAGCATTRLMENTLAEISTVGQIPSQEINLRGLCKTIFIPANISMLAIAIYPSLDRQNITLTKESSVGIVLTKMYPYQDEFANVRDHKVQINMGEATSVTLNVFFGIDYNDKDCFMINLIDNSIPEKKYCPDNAFNDDIVLNSSFVISDYVETFSSGYYIRYFPSFDNTISSTSQPISSSSLGTSVTQSLTTQPSTKPTNAPSSDYPTKTVFFTQTPTTQPSTKPTNAPSSDNPTKTPNPTTKTYPTTTSRYESTTSYSHNTEYTFVSLAVTAYLISLLQ